MWLPLSVLFSTHKDFQKGLKRVDPHFLLVYVGDKCLRWPFWGIWELDSQCLKAKSLAALAQKPAISVVYAATGEVSPLCLRKFQHPRKDYQNHLSKMSARASRVTGTLSPKLLSCSGMSFTPEQLGAESQCSCDLCPCCLSSRACNIPAWGSACRRAGEKTRSWTCTYLWQSQQSFHRNHFGQRGRYQGVLYIQFIFCLLKDDMKKDRRVLTTDMVLKCKCSKLSRRGELMSLKEIISAWQ